MPLWTELRRRKRFQAGAAYAVIRRAAIPGLLILSTLLMPSARTAVPIDPGFWDSYEPYRQYSSETIRDLMALGEGDLLETARDIDGLELRVIGRETSASALVSARVVIDSIARERLQVKVIPFALPRNGNREAAPRRRQLTPEEAGALEALLEDSAFWEAPHDIDGQAFGNDRAAGCTDAGRWIVEAVKPGSYQIITRSTCDGLDPIVAEIRDFLLGIAGISATGGTEP